MKKKQALLTLRDIKLEDYSKVIAAMKQDLKPRHRRFLLISHKSCVSGNLFPKINKLTILEKKQRL